MELLSRLEGSQVDIEIVHEIEGRLEIGQEAIKPVGEYECRLFRSTSTSSGLSKNHLGSSETSQC